MGQPAAKQGDRIMAMDMHFVPPGPVPGSVLTPAPFSAPLQTGLSTNVNIMGLPAATLGSGGSNTPPHPPPMVATNLGTIIAGSATVMINGKPAARAGDMAMTCNDPAPLPIGQVMATGTVNIG